MDYEARFEALMTTTDPDPTAEIAEVVNLAVILNEGTANEHCRLLSTAVSLLCNRCTQLEQQLDDLRASVRSLQSQPFNH